MHVVSAGVHHAGHGARVVEPGLLLHREGVHVGTKHHDRAVAAGQHADDARAADRFGDLEAVLTQQAAATAAVRVSRPDSSGCAWRSR